MGKNADIERHINEIFICHCFGVLSRLLSLLLKSDYFFVFFPDPRVNDWAMMSSPVPTLLICLFYAYFSTVIGPKLMENRKPFDLRNVLIYYNLAQTLFSAWIFYEYLMSGWWGSYSFRCQPVDYTHSPMGLRVTIKMIVIFRMQ